MPSRVRSTRVIVSFVERRPMELRLSRRVLAMRRLLLMMRAFMSKRFRLRVKRLTVLPSVGRMDFAPIRESVICLGY